MFASKVANLTRIETQHLLNCSIKGKTIGLLSFTQSYSSLKENSIKEKYTNSIEEKYKQKLLERAKEQGFETIEDLKQNLQEQILEKKKQFNKVDPLKDLQEYQEKMSKNFSKDKTISKGPIDTSLEQKPFKTLNSYLQLEKIKNLSKQEIEFLWRARFANKDNTLHAVVPPMVFEPMYKNAKQNPAFVLPLPRELDPTSTDAKDNGNSKNKTEKNNNNHDEQSVGMELHYVQWNFVGPTTVHCMVTSLAEFKLHKEFARPHITMSFHTDLIKDKDLVLMNGIVEPDCNVSMQDAQLLLLNIQRFYGCMGESTPVAAKRVQLLKDFTKGSENFNIDLLIELSQSLE